MMLTLRHHHRKIFSARRRGASVMMVLALLSIAMAVSYAMLRAQVNSAQLGDNGQLNVSARAAAMSGMAAALRKMHETSWSGIGTTLAGSAGQYQSYSVTFITGDDQLTASDPKYSEWPLRVTILSTGTSVNPKQTEVTATHRIRAVAVLIPRALPSEPTNFNSATTTYTVFQHSAAEFDIEWPCRITGQVRLQDRLRILDTYPQPAAAQSRYLSDLNLMRQNGYSDYRPFNSTLSMPYSKTTTTVRNLVTSNLGVSTLDVAASTTSLAFPTSATSYKLYPGGTSYNMTTLSATISNSALAPDPQTNPLGIFRRSGDVTLGNNVTVQGTIIATGDVAVSGTNVTLQAYSAQALDGSTTSIQLPVVLCGDDFLINPAAGVTVRGLVATYDAFNILPGTRTTSFDLKGRLLCQDFTADTRTEWNMSTLAWTVLWTAFSNQLSGANPQKYLPVWLQNQGLPYVPILTIAPETSSVRYHWQDNTNPFYTSKAADGGLRWSLLRWDDLN